MKLRLKKLIGRFKKYVKKYVADFETCVWLENETFVWAWAVCEIGNESNFVYGNSIDTFIDFCKSQKNCIMYFHNLKFDRGIPSILSIKKWI